MVNASVLQETSPLMASTVGLASSVNILQELIAHTALTETAKIVKALKSDFVLSANQDLL